MSPTLRTAPRNLASLLVQFALFVVLPGCEQLFGPSDRHLAHSVPRSHLVGPWAVTAESIKRLEDLGYRDHVTVGDHRFELKDNGRCSFRSFPHYAGPKKVVEVAGQIPVPGYLSVETGCTWRLVSDKIYVLSRERQVPVVELQMSFRRAPIMISARFNVGGKDGRLVLWDYVGDPEEERYIDFVKE